MNRHGTAIPRADESLGDAPDIVGIVKRHPALLTPAPLLLVDVLAIILLDPRRVLQEHLGQVGRPPRQVDLSGLWPWNMPQSRSTGALLVWSRCRLPVTERAAP